MNKYHVVVLIAEPNDEGQILVVAVSADSDTMVVDLGTFLGVALAQYLNEGFQIDSTIALDSGRSQYTLIRCTQTSGPCNWHCMC